MNLEAVSVSNVRSIAQAELACAAGLTLIVYFATHR